MVITDALTVKLVHTAGLLVSLREDLSFRQIFLDGRKLPPDPNPSWMGYSVGRWEGDTYVGTYELKRPDGSTLAFVITREGPTLVAQRTGRAKAPLVAVSQTRFRGQAEFEIVPDTNGTITHFTPISAEGQNTARRIR